MRFEIIHGDNYGLVHLIADHPANFKLASSFGHDHSPGVLKPKFAFAQDRLDLCDLALHDPWAAAGGQFAHHLLKAQVEELFLIFLDLRAQLLVVKVAQFVGFHSAPSTSSRPMILHLIGIFWAARLNASLAISGRTPPSSNMIRPGLTTAT